MSEVAKIEDQLRRAFEGDAWHGPSLRELLSDVAAERAACRPIARAHSIWELVLHIAAWDDVVRRRLEGEPIAELSPAEDFPSVREASATAWEEAREGLQRGHRRLRRAIAQLEEGSLDESVPGTSYTVYTMLHGVVQHDLYHAGQIALLRRATA